MSETVTIRNDALAATIGFKGAELHSLVPAWGGELIWQADPAIWAWHAPNLFPIVGALTEGTLVHKDNRYAMKSHGFLRHSTLALASREKDSVSFRLTDTEESRRQFPFAFDLLVGFRLEADKLVQSFEVGNPAGESLLISIGGHPAFNWPLSPSLPRAAHQVTFATDEPQDIRRVDGTGLGAKTHPTPVKGRVLALEDSLFDNDAVIWDHLHSKSLTFGVSGELGIEMDYGDFPHFGIWTKPGGTPFLCLEPWQGYISPTGFAGEFADKPGVVAIAPGTKRRWSLSIRPIQHLPG